MKKQQLPNFNKKFKIWKACGDALRPNLDYVVFQNGYAYTSDAHIIVKIGLTDLTGLEPESAGRLNGFCIHKDCYRMIAGQPIMDINTGENASINFGEFEINLQTIEAVNPPNFERIFVKQVEKHPIEKIGISGKFFGNLIDAIGCSNIRMDFSNEMSQIIVTPILDEYIDVKGLIMPVCIY